MTDIKFDVVGIGNAIVDILANADYEFINTHGLIKGAMSLIDANEIDLLYNKIGTAIECSGGSAANTIAAIASLGSRGAFIGKVNDDQLGKIFRHDIRSLGIVFDTNPAHGDAATARSLILVTPDAQRTMQTYLGACVELSADDIDEEIIAASAITYLEGYLWDPDQAKKAFIKAAITARAANRMVALSLSDPFCVDRHREEFIDLLNNHIDILFANEEEIMSLYQVETLDDAIQRLRGHCHIAALTRGADGAVVLSADEVHVLDAYKIDNVIDTTGAGDAYAAGFLHGLCADIPLDECGRIGSIVAAEAISHMGARPATSLEQLVDKALR